MLRFSPLNWYVCEENDYTKDIRIIAVFLRRCEAEKFILNSISNYYVLIDNEGNITQLR